MNNTIKESLISIIVPIYNSENDLEQCIESIVNQTYDNLEIILVNDGSTDKSLEICRRWEKKDKRIIVIDKTNGGLASSRNAGLEKASGEYIGFVDHDDYIDSKMYEIMMNDMRNNNADIVMCSSYGLYENGDLERSYAGYDSFKATGKEVTKRMLEYEKIFCSSVWSKLYKRKVIGDIRFVDEIVLGEDYYFNGRLYPRINSFYYNKEPFYYYRKREGSMSRDVVNDHFFDKYKVVDKLVDYYEENGFGKREDFANIRLGISYEIVYRLYLNKAEKKYKKKWKKIFKQASKEYNGDNYKDKIRVFMINNFASFYVKIKK